MFCGVRSANTRHRVKFRQYRSKVAEILRFYGFPKKRPPPPWIFENSNSYLPIRLRDQICVTVKFRQDRSICWWDMAIFLFFKMVGRPPCWIFKIAILTVLRHKDCQCASPFQISSKSVKSLWRYCDFTLFQNDGLRHLGFSKISIFQHWYV